MENYVSSHPCSATDTNTHTWAETYESNSYAKHFCCLSSFLRKNQDFYNKQLSIMTDHSGHILRYYIPLYATKDS